MDRATHMKLPTRWYSGANYYDGSHEGDGHRLGTLDLDIASTAFLLVDCDEGADEVRVDQFIAPALHAAREAGFHVVYVHNDMALVDEPGAIRRDIHGVRWGHVDAAKAPARARVPLIPTYRDSIAPLDHEPDVPKREWSGFTDTQLDYHLRCYRTDTLVAVGFSQRACLYQTLTGAVERNYRVVMLRDCTYSAEYPDTVDPTIPEGGWLSKIMLRNFEHTIGYTSTSEEFVAACQVISEGALMK